MSKGLLAAAVWLVSIPRADVLADDGALNLASLLERFSSLPGLSARFRERKEMDLLAVPVESEGEIHFAPPGRFVRRVESPTSSVALIEGDTLRLRSRDRVERIDLSRNPAVAGFVESFRHVLAGDRNALERMFHLELDRIETRGPGEPRWRLTLTPEEEPLSKLLRTLVLRGRGVKVETMEMVERTGDRTRTEFFDVRIRSFSDAEEARVFRLGR